MKINEIKELLRIKGQSHILNFYDELSDSEKEELCQQIEKTDFDIIENSRNAKKQAVRGKIEPIVVKTVKEINSEEARYREIGLKAIKGGRVGAVLLAGGMGTRLGADGPKGKCDIGVTRPIYIFERIIANLMDVVNESGVYVHLFIMTSEKNNDETVAFFEEKNYFGYPSDYVHFFIQEMAPATDYDGRVYMEAKNRIATSPNGNGGWYVSMEKSGMNQIARKAGIEWLNVFAVDNVLQRIADPVFLGATIDSGSVTGAKVIRKANPEEKVGVLCLENGYPSIVEYYELTDEMKVMVDEKGDLVYNYGVILNYLFKTSKLDEIAARKLPLHVVEKKIPYIDSEGTYIEPEEPNGYKYETLILDMINIMETCLGYEVVREREFAPIKNKTGVDSIESARTLLEYNGIEL